MDFKERVYSVLVVSTSEKFNAATADYFAVPTFSPVQTVSGVSVAKRALAERDFDFKARYDLKQGIHEAIEWYRSAGWL